MLDEQQKRGLPVSIKVSVERYTINATAVGYLPLDPVSLWGILAATESRPVFRVENRKQLSFIEGRIVEQVTFVAPVRLLLWRPVARTEVHQTVDMSDPSSVKVAFHLLHSDMMSRLSGSWHFRQIEAPSKVSLGLTEVTYKFAMWPKGVPSALRFMPGLLDAVKSAVLREAAQLFDKLIFVAGKVQPGFSVIDAAREASAEVEAAGGSFKCLQLKHAGHAAAAAAAAVAEAAARQEYKHQQQQEKVVCHQLDDVSSECEDDDCLMTLDSCGSNISTNTCSLGLDTASECESECRGRMSSSSGGSSSSRGSLSSGGSISNGGSISSGGASTAGLVTALSKSFSAMMQPATEAATAN